LANFSTFSCWRIYENNKGKIPHSLENLSAMENLKLGNNRLESTLPSTMCDAFPNLQYLVIFEKKLKGEIPAYI